MIEARFNKRSAAKAKAHRSDRGVSPEKQAA
jgi:hypothetical protein